MRTLVLILFGLTALAAESEPVRLTEKVIGIEKHDGTEQLIVQIFNDEGVPLLGADGTPLEKQESVTEGTKLPKDVRSVRYNTEDGSAVLEDEKQGTYFFSDAFSNPQQKILSELEKLYKAE